jgi:hypothetical protein
LGEGRWLRPGTGPFGRIVGSSSLAEIVGGYDLVVVAVALTAGTRGLISADVFTEGRPLRNVVDKRLRYVGSASLVGTSREGGIG